MLSIGREGCFVSFEVAGVKACLLHITLHITPRSGPQSIELSVELSLGFYKGAAVVTHWLIAGVGVLGKHSVNGGDEDQY